MRAAMRAFASSGFHGTSLRAIALEVGISHVGLAYHFKSKEELLAAVLAHRDEVVTAQLEPLFDGPLEDLLVAVVQHNQRTPALVQLYATLSSEACHAAHPAHAYFTERYAWLRSSIVANLRALQPPDAWTDDEEAAGVAATIIAVMDGLQVQWLLDPGLDVLTALGSFLRRVLR